MSIACVMGRSWRSSTDWSGIDPRNNGKKCYADEPLVMQLEGIHVDDKLPFVEKPIEIMEWEIKRLKRNQILLVKVR
nr:putative reverse transcriptase domain-containing protein [Tanacetum cinerariifolium]